MADASLESKPSSSFSTSSLAYLSFASFSYPPHSQEKSYPHQMTPAYSGTVEAI